MVRLECLVAQQHAEPLDPATHLRLRLLGETAVTLAQLDAKEKDATAHLAELTKAAGSPSTSSAACPPARRPNGAAPLSMVVRQHQVEARQEPD